MLFAVIASFSALDVQFAKYASNPNFVPFFALLFFVALEPFLRGAQKIRHVLLAAIAFAAALQLHFVAGGALLIALLLLRLRRKIEPKLAETAIFFSVAALLLLPWLANEFAHGFGGGRAMTAVASGWPGLAAIPGRLLDAATFALSLWLTQHTYFKTIAWDTQKFWFAGVLMMNFIAVEILIWSESRGRVPKNDRTPMLPPRLSALLTAWLAGFLIILLLPIGLTSFLPIHYFTGLLPLAFILLAAGLAKLANRGYRHSSAALLASFLLWQLYQIILYHQRFPSLLTAWF